VSVEQKPFITKNTLILNNSFDILIEEMVRNYAHFNFYGNEDMDS
jgi:hypothetical protein